MAPRQLFLAVLVTTLAVAAVVLVWPAAAQQPAATDGYGSGAAWVPNAPQAYRPGTRPIVPGAPPQPMPTTRPNTWPGGSAEPLRGDNEDDPPPYYPPNRLQEAAPQQFSPQAPQVGDCPNFRVNENGTVPFDATVPRVANVPPLGPPAWQPAPVAAELKPFERAQMAGGVGSEAILVSDLIATLDTLLERNAPDKIPPEQMEIQRRGLIQEVLTAIDEAQSGGGDGGTADPEKQSRRMMLQQLLKQQIETKLMYYDAKSKIPTERFPEIEKQLIKQFDQFEVKKLLKRHKVESRRELDQALRARGDSFERERRAFIEQSLAHQWLREQVKFHEEITFDQLLRYYRERTTEFDKPARTRWQELMVPFSRFPLKEEAREAIAAMGNRVLQGVDFAEAAKAGGSATDGAVRDWPDKAQIVAAAVEQAIQGLPLGQLSPILEDVRGYHIVRVAERQEARRGTFEESQAEIREKIRQQRTQQQTQEYLDGLKKQIPVWTVLEGKNDRPRVSERSGYPPRR